MITMETVDRYVKYFYNGMESYALTFFRYCLHNGMISPVMEKYIEDCIGTQIEEEC